MFTSQADSALTLRVRPNQNSQVINKNIVPTALQFERPDGNRAIKPIHFMDGFCAIKQGGTRFRKRQFIFTRNVVCDGTKQTTKWWYDPNTKQIKNNGANSKRGWCWSVNPKATKTTYVRLVKCRHPRVTMQDAEYVAKSQADTMFDWSPEGFLTPERNDRIILQMVQNKRIQAVDKWKSGWSYR